MALKEFPENDAGDEPDISYHTGAVLKFLRVISAIW